jgi:hypothetical protein
MAGQYLQRNPTSTGNRKVHTWSGWVKQNRLNTAASNNIWYVASGGSSEWRIFIANTGNLIVSDYIPSPPGIAMQFQTARLLRDHGSWFHLLVSVDTTQSTGGDRIKIYLDGVRITEFSSTTYGNQNHETRMNAVEEVNYLGQNTVGGGTYQAYCELFDVYSVDGQALTPEVFGFYKDGNGYISAGSTQSTDFRNGQWVPRTPREIKNLINDNGGFGVNGFYLPMNDSSNFGADFHTTPNSIITLKGENLPQPRNGAPETTDAYVSQLRTDPYADNLVLAVPGISTATGANLVTNGTFDTNIAGWTAQNAVISWDEGELHVDDSANAGAYSSANQTITTVIGKRYTMTVDIISTSGTPSIAVYSSGWSSQAGDVFYSTYSSTGKKQVIFTATSTSSTISLQTSGTTLTVYDNVVVKQEDAPRDYSADIKGSGTNKTLTANGNAGVGYEIPSYYGSAMRFNNDGTNGAGNTDVINVPTSSDFVFTGDVTMECWFHPLATPSTAACIMGQWKSGGGTDRNFQVYFDTSRRVIAYFNSSATNYDTGTSSALSLNQWYHIAVEKYGSNMTLYVNGVAVGINTNTPTAGNTSTVPFTIGAETESGGTITGADYGIDGYIQDVRVYKGVAKYKGGFDVPKPYTPVGFESWRQVSDTCKNNFATWNSLIPSTFTYSDGNLTGTNSGSNTTASTIGGSSGKYYAEFRKPDTTHMNVGIARYTLQNESYTGEGSSSFGIFTGNTPQRIWHNGGYSDHTEVFNTAWQDTDIMMLALDLDNKKCWWGKNGQWLTGASPENGTLPHVDFGNGGSGIYYNVDFNDDDVVFRQGTSGSNGAIANFGQNPSFSGTVTAGTYADGNGKGLFKYAPPTGFLALCEDNLPEPTIKDPGEHFKTVLYRGDGNNGHSITGVGFQPDLVWLKERTSTSSHQWHDSVRGAGNVLFSNTTNAESYSDTYLYSLDSDGFTLGSSGGVNASTDDYVAWCWKAGGPAVTNTDGSITSQVSVNQDAGFSIATWTGNGQSSQSIGHGLGKTPDFYIWKSRDNAREWHISHKDLTAYNYTLYFTSGAEVNNDKVSQAPSSTLIYPAASNVINANSEDYVGYFWTEIEGYSKFGSYIGNSDSDGPFVYCGFKPAFVIIKGATASATYQSYQSWAIKDSSRHPSNVPNVLTLWANHTYPEGKRGQGDADTFAENFDFLSNGFKISSSSSYEVETNETNRTYIFAAFAESPFQTANAK